MFNYFLSIFLFFAISTSFAETILVVLDKKFCGEYSFANKVKLASKNLGWHADIIDYSELKSISTKSYDFALCLTPGDFQHITCPKYLTLFLPDRNYFDDVGEFASSYNNFDGYLMSFDPQNYPNLNKFFIELKKKPYLFWLPTSCTTNCEAKSFNKLFWIEARWGDRVSEKKYKKLFSIITKASIVDAWGPTYKKLIPFEGDEVFKKMSQDGISLVIHSDIHKSFGIPTGRIFEAMAVGNMIICDQHPFVMNVLNDNALYVDFSQNIDKIENQIFHHLKWIKNNPELAQIKARNSHKIFQEHYTLENQLKELDKLNKHLKSKTNYESQQNN